MKRFVLLVVVVFGAIGVQGQYNQSTRKGNSQSLTLDRFYFGGGGGFGAGTVDGYNYTYFSLLPVIGYRLTDQFSVGASITYQQYNYKNTPNGSYAFTQYGIGPFVRYTFNQVFFQAEYDLINAPSYNNVGEVVHSNYSRLFFGLGYTFPLGRKGAVNALAMYDVLYKVPSVFNSPAVIRIYFTI
jgi:hypothetical protein